MFKINVNEKFKNSIIAEREPVALVKNQGKISQKKILKMENDNLSKKWGYLRKILERSGPFDSESFTPSTEILEFLNNTCKVLIIGKY
jgi:hypothetical protein